MTDQDPIAVALAHAADQISAKVVNGACPACNAEDWAFPTDGAVAVQWATLREGRVVLTGTIHLAIGFTCRNCGYVRLHLPLQSDLDGSGG